MISWLPPHHGSHPATAMSWQFPTSAACITSTASTAPPKRSDPSQRPVFARSREATRVPTPLGSHRWPRDRFPCLPPRSSVLGATPRRFFTGLHPKTGGDNSFSPPQQLRVHSRPDSAPKLVVTLIFHPHTPDDRVVSPPQELTRNTEVIAIPHLSGLHHEYRLDRAA
jgi:hypothetical protein